MSTQTAGRAPAAAPAAYASSTSTSGSPAQPATATTSTGDAGMRWFDIALLVLQDAGRPLRAADIVSRAAEMGLRPRSRTRTPAQSLNRDLHAAARRGDGRVSCGPGSGQFHLRTGTLPGSPVSWPQIAAAVLASRGGALTSRQILRAARELNLLPASPEAPCTPTQLRDALTAAVAGGQTCVRRGPGRYQFQLPGVGSSVAGAESASSAGRATTGKRAPAPRLPTEPLEGFVELAGGFAGLGLVAGPDSSTSWRRFVDRSYRAYQRAVTRGWVDIWAADALAVKAFGVHPCVIWRESWWQAIAEPAEAAEPAQNEPAEGRTDPPAPDSAAPAQHAA